MWSRSQNFLGASFSKMFRLFQEPSLLTRPFSSDESDAGHFLLLLTVDKKTKTGGLGFLSMWRLLHDIRTSIIETRAIHFLNVVDEWSEIPTHQEINVSSIRTSGYIKKR